MKPDQKKTKKPTEPEATNPPEPEPEPAREQERPRQTPIMPPGQSDHGPSASQGQQGSQGNDTSATGRQPGQTPGQDGNMPAKQGVKAKVRVRTPMASRRVQVRARVASHLRADRGTRRILVLSPALRARVEARPRAPVRSQTPARTAILAARPRDKMATRAARVRRVNAGRRRQATARSPAKEPEPARMARAPKARAAIRTRATRRAGRAALPRRGPAAARSPSRAATRVPRGISPAVLEGRSQVAANPQASPAREINKVAREAARSVVVALRDRARPERRPRTTANLRHGLPTLRTRLAKTSLRKASRKPTWCCGRSRTFLPRMPSRPISRRKPG